MERETKQAVALRLRQAGWSLRQIGRELGVSHEAVRAWLAADGAAAAFKEEVRQKALARPRRAAVAKKRPGFLVLPSDVEGKGQPWWRAAPPLVWVSIATGEVLAFKWPLE